MSQEVPEKVHSDQTNNVNPILTFLCSLLLVCPGLAKDKQPNVVILLADDLGSQDLGCYGGPVKTPALDSLAARGVKFTDFHAGAAVCSPSRATLLTGRQNLRTGIYGVLQDQWHNMHLLEREVTIAEVLQQAGYGTAHFGKWHIGMTSGKRKKPSPTRHGFDYWFGLSNGAHPNHRNPTNFMRNGKRVGPMKGYSCQIVVSDAINWLETKPEQDQPFFLNIWFNEPHSKLAAPDEIVSIYGDLKDEAALYSATVDNTDRAIGRLVEKLEAMGKLDNTIIIYSSDHGSYRPDRNGGLKGNKGSNFQGGLRSPGIFFWPVGIRGGRIESTSSGAVDLLPTICGLAGIDKPKGVHLDGADLSPLLIEKGTFKRSQPMIWLSPSSVHLATLREGNYTLMGYRGYKLPSNQVRKNELVLQMAKMAGIDPSLSNLGSRVTNTTFTSPEYTRLKNEFVRARTFQESWIPIIKKGGFSRFALYDLESDPLQKKDVSKQRPKVNERLKKKLLELYKDVLEDAPDWPVVDNNAGGQSIADNWHQWRGPGNNGVSRTADPPLRWSEEKNLRWKAEIQGTGTGSPIVWGNKVFVTTAINTGRVDPSLPKPEDQPERVFGIKHPNTSYEMFVLCFNRNTGKELWRDVARTLVPHEGHHRHASYASASAYCDGERVYCWFGSAGMFAYSLDGKRLWERDLGRAKVGASLGEGSSPVVHDGKIIIVRDHAGQSTIEVMDASDGRTIWKKDRDEKNAWATPAIAEHNGATQVITAASNRVRSYDLESGEIIWHAEGLTGNCTPSPIVDGKVVYCMSGYKGYSLLAIPITGKGDVTDSILWKVERGTPYVPSPILYDGLLYITQANQNIMTSVDVKDGSRVIERERLPGLGGIYSSPVGAAGRIYMTDRKGTVLVLERGSEVKVLATNQLDDNFHASPALAGRQLFLRGMRFLYCLEEGALR
ncbi:MAG: sulfatase-like hydrolase/transferase [Verrucomicrobiaceae bacterium]|nr:sulfatase-like hydrolase/transferase [Verrucomicrobiaceae bacterium]